MEPIRLGAAMGAEVRGVDLSEPLDDRVVERIRSAFLEHLVLVFRGQTLTPFEQVAFTERFGRVEPHPLRPRPSHTDHEGVFILENRPGLRGARNDIWHTDLSHEKCPPAASVLHAIEAAENRGNTMFCNMYAAYESLSAGMRKMLDSVHAIHSGEVTAQRFSNEPNTDALPVAFVPPPVSHPVVRSHPETGRKALYVNPLFVVQLEHMTEDESEPVLEYLYAAATRPENVYRHRWRTGDVLMWDNRCAMHYGVYDYGETMSRIMHRTTAAGDQPF